LSALVFIRNERVNEPEEGLVCVSVCVCRIVECCMKYFICSV
jgi:hypothetical protein